MPRQFSINYQDISIDPKDVAKVIGYKENAVPLMVKDEIHWALSEIEKVCNLKGGYQIFQDISLGTGQLFIGKQVFHTQKMITGFLKHSNALAFMVCTAGIEVSEWIRQLFLESNSLKAYVVDVVASLLVERTADYVHLQIENEAADQNLKITNRYSPGYCNWDIREQHQLFALLPEKFCGIQLTEEALMVPTKSISAVVGIGDKVTKKSYSCEICHREDCNYRELL